jgi:Sigma-70 region 2/TOBE-like domain
VFLSIPFSYALLFSQYRKELLTFASQHSNEEIAEDLVQEAYLRLIRQSEKEKIENPRAYLYAITRNLSTDYLRQGQIRSLYHDNGETELEHVADPQLQPDAKIEAQHRLQRCLAVEPSVLLLDEPFGALDASVRKDLRLWLRHLHQKLNVTTIFVTHDQEEAMEVSSQIVVLNRGKIEQKGTPSEIYDHPINDFVSHFIGQTNVFHLEKEDSEWLKSAGVVVDETEGATVHVRPHHIKVEKQNSSISSAFFVDDWQHLGATIRLELSDGKHNGSTKTIFAEMPSEQFKELKLDKGDQVSLFIKHANWFNLEKPLAPEATTNIL